MESWELVWNAAAPLLPTRGLERLRTALLEDDPRLLQGSTTSPPPLVCCQDWQCEGACLLGYPFAFEEEEGDLPKDPEIGCQSPMQHKPGVRTVGEVEENFARVCFELDQALGEPAACRLLLNWFDETPRERMRAALTPCVEAELERRKAVSL